MGIRNGKDSVPRLRSKDDILKRPKGQQDEKLLSKVRLANDDFATDMRLFGATLRIDGALNVEDVKTSPQGDVYTQYGAFRDKGEVASRKQALLGLPKGSKKISNLSCLALPTQVLQKNSSGSSVRMRRTP